MTDTNGNFRFLKVPPGRYKVTVTMPGFTTFEQENVVVTLGKNTDVGAAALQLANVQEAVTVTSATPLIDTRKVETGATFSTDRAERHPDLARHLRPDAADAGHPARHGQRGGRASGVAGGPDFSSEGLRPA